MVTIPLPSLLLLLLEQFSVNAGAGNDTIYFGNSVSATSIIGGAGNDYVTFAGALTGTGTVN